VSTTLIIVPCGQAKVWDGDPERGPVPAREAYTGAPFKVNRAYAERHGDRWVILSARYGFIPPDFVLPGPYDVTFKKRATGPVEVATLMDQIRAQGLHEFGRVVGLGGKEYRDMIGAAFAPFGPAVEFPFAGLAIGLAMRATKRATRSGLAARPRSPPRCRCSCTTLAVVHRSLRRSSGRRGASSCAGRIALVSFSSRAAAANASRWGGDSSIPFHRSIFARVRGASSMIWARYEISVADLFGPRLP
jgi:hypothetical protein